MKWNGSGFLTGVPARDLKPAEVKRYGKKRLLKSGLYYEAKINTEQKEDKLLGTDQENKEA